MTAITLINPPGIKCTGALQIHSPNPPLGLAYIAAMVKESGRSLTVIDANGEALDAIHPFPMRNDFMLQGLTIDEIVDRIPIETKVVGITCLFSTSWPIVRTVLERVRERFPDALLVAGGEHVTAVPEHALEDSPADVLVLGEGDETVLTLLSAWENGDPLESVPGLAFRRDGEIVNTGLGKRIKGIDELPFPAWELFPIREYIVRRQTNGVNMGPSMPLMTTRGCPYQCTFCSNKGMWTQRYVLHSPKRVADEMAYYIEQYGVTNFDLQDLTAMVKRSWAIELCKEIRARKFNITWQMPTGTRSEVFDEELLDQLYQSGCRLLSFAPESGSPEMLESIKKQVDIEHMMEAIRAALKKNFKISCFVVIGFPNERRETLYATMKMLRRFAAVGVHDVTISKFVPYPGSLLFTTLLDEGEVELNDRFYLSSMDLYARDTKSYSKNYTARQLYWQMIWMFYNFYILSFMMRPLRVIKVLWKAIRTGEEDTKYAKWFVYRFRSRSQWINT